MAMPSVSPTTLRNDTGAKFATIRPIQQFDHTTYLSKGAEAVLGGFHSA